MIEAPNFGSLIVPVLKAVAEKPGATLSDLTQMLPGIIEIADLPTAEEAKLQRRLAAAVKLLVREGYLNRDAAGTLSITEKAAIAGANQPAQDVEKADEQPDAQREAAELTALLAAAEIRFHPIDARNVCMTFHFKLRDWIVQARVHHGWLFLRSYVMLLPAKGPIRAKIQDALLRMNSSLSMTKFTVPRKQSVYAELDYRLDHLDPESIKGLLYTFGDGIDANYGHLFRIATSGEALEQLERAFKRGEARSHAL